MYRVDRNDFYTVQKNATVYTPMPVSDFIFKTISMHIDKDKPILDPCVGGGNLLKPFDDNGFQTIGIDIEDQGYPRTLVKNYLAVKCGELPSPSLVIMNPPFNIDDKTKTYIKKHYHGRPLLPEIWLQKAIELFGIDIPIILFTPYGLRLNQTVNSKRWQKFISNEYPAISSIIALPKDIFEGILFHSEILIFNIDGLRGHYFYG
ncbi:MAG: SAM-dependent methyltransferase [Candidatus Saccharibacteria bacterium]|nr:SAM-dependent methyltransferase [Candidatus Saccharibacteria bacterium]